MAGDLAKFIEELRTRRSLSQRQLAERAGISHTEVWRLETGERKNPSPPVLKALAPHLGVSYERLMRKAGYLEEKVDHTGYTEMIYRDENNKVVDIFRRATDMYEKDSEWANLAYRVSAADLSKTEMDLIKAQTKSLLEQFIKIKNK
ncbi:MAG: helix-turn-helix domain-containing protein [Bacillota bacterium]